jgi:hypothetical protein
MVVIGDIDIAAEQNGPANTDVLDSRHDAVSRDASAIPYLEQ